MKYLRLLAFLCVYFLSSFLSVVHAQQAMTLSVTPPLFQLNVAPGETWKSSIKVVNSNTFPLTVYTELYNFEPKGEDGQGQLLPRTDGDGSSTGMLADWLTITSDPIVIPPEKVVDVPVSVSIPKDASPGGHFAAVLTGTRPPARTGASMVRTSQVVTSLFFVRVAGDIHESGTVREFSVAHPFQESPQADFVVRFQNTGNVHLQPQGGITIFNMWGKERGYIPINQRSHFGNVLPDSIRKFDFSWRGEASLADIGRYTAEVSLVYGEAGRQTATDRVNFWIIPVRATLITLVSLGILISFIIWIVRRYVRRAMYLAGYEAPARSASVQMHATTLRSTKKALVLPLQEGVLDLRKRIQENDEHVSLISIFYGYVRSYYLFFLGLVGASIVIFAIGWYLSDVLQKQKKYEVTVQHGDTGVVLSEEEVLHEKLRANDSAASEAEASTTQKFDVVLVNTSATPGIAAQAAHILESKGFSIAHVLHEQDAKATSTIFYTDGLRESAERMRTELGIPTARIASSSFTGIRIIVGSDAPQG